MNIYLPIKKILEETGITEQDHTNLRQAFKFADTVPRPRLKEAYQFVSTPTCSI